jgi:hypothetical protein
MSHLTEAEMGNITGGSTDPYTTSIDAMCAAVAWNSFWGIAVSPFAEAFCVGWAIGRVLQ